MTLIEAAKLAREALTESKEHIAKHKRLEAITSLNQAIAEAEQQEPVGQLLEEAFGRGQVMWFNKPADQSMLYTSPPASKPWQGLTDDEMNKVWYAMQNIMGWYSFQEIARAIEAKLKEKNT